MTAILAAALGVLFFIGLVVLGIFAMLWYLKEQLEP